jgi:hypothetical protein
MPEKLTSRALRVTSCINVIRGSFGAPPAAGTGMRLCGAWQDGTGGAAPCSELRASMLCSFDTLQSALLPMDGMHGEGRCRMSCSTAVGRGRTEEHGKIKRGRNPAA